MCCSGGSHTSPKGCSAWGHPVSPGQEDTDGDCHLVQTGLSPGVWPGHSAQRMGVEELNLKASSGSREVGILFKDTPRDMEQDEVSCPQLRVTSTDHSTNCSCPGSLCGKSQAPSPAG